MTKNIPIFVSWVPAYLEEFTRATIALVFELGFIGDFISDSDPDLLLEWIEATQGPCGSLWKLLNHGFPDVSRVNNSGAGIKPSVKIRELQRWNDDNDGLSFSLSRFPGRCATDVVQSGNWWTDLSSSIGRSGQGQPSPFRFQICVFHVFSMFVPFCIRNNR